MKTHHLIIVSTALFLVLFYNENLGINLSLLGVFYALLTFYKTPERNKTKVFLGLLVTSILSSVAFAWFGDFPSFLALSISLLLLDLKSKSKELNSIFFIPVLITNLFTFVCRFFNFKDWFPVGKSESKLQKLIAIVLIPSFFIVVFFAIYTYGSNQFATFFSNFEWNVNFLQAFALAALGFFIAFNYWNFTIERFLYKLNHQFKNEFVNEDKTQNPTFSFLDLDFERLSGVISLMALNLMLVFFILSYNYEQFFEVKKISSDLSIDTHERVNSVILSIVMAIIVILFYFKSNFNFDKKAGLLKLSAKIWIVLNIILVISASFKNTEYIAALGLTYKRMGVYAFLILSIIGLIMTFIKIQKQKTNAFLVNQMFWYFYGTILVCSFVNWGGFATAYNIDHKKGDYFFLNSLNFNDQLLETNFPNEYQPKYNYQTEQLENASFLSKILYYESLSKD